MINRIAPIAVCLGSMLLCQAAQAQPVAGSIEGGLQDLAQAVVSKSNQNSADVIAVLPFPNSDGSCSVLSTYLADELIQSLFSVSGSKLRIVERSQLEALLREIKLGDGGLLNPVTTQKLGTLSGVKALVLGTVTVIGDHIRINARLISTANGQTVSAAGIGIARSGEIDGLLQQPINNRDGLCGSAGTGGADNASDAEPSTSGPALSGPRTATLEGVTFSVRSVVRSPDRKTISIVLALTDKLKNSVAAVLVEPKPALVDDQAALPNLALANGIQVCNNFYAANWCSLQWPRTQWTTLSPEMPTMLLLSFSSKQPLQGSHISLAASLLLAPPPGDDPTNPPPATPVSVSLADIPIPAARPAR